MATTSSFAAGFDAAAFTTAIVNTMLMGMPQTEAQQLTWVWNRDRTYEPDDPAGNPYDWTQTPVTDEPGNDDEDDGEVIINYALEFSARPAGSQTTPIGEFDTSRVVVTVFEDDFQTVSTADYVRIDDANYDIQLDSPPYFLFGVGFRDVMLVARDEA